MDIAFVEVRNIGSDDVGKAQAHGSALGAIWARLTGPAGMIIRHPSSAGLG
jgi:hypothetical protein